MAAPAKKAPAKKAAPPAKKAPSKASAAKPEAKKAAPPPEREPVFDGQAEANPAPPEKKGSASDTLDAVAADRGWVQSPSPEGFDVTYTKVNPVLGGYEHLRVAFKGTGIGDVEHENLNRRVPFPADGSKLDNAISVLTGEPA